MLKTFFTVWNMAKAENNYRYERKFLISELSRYDTEMAVKLHPAMFMRIYPSRYINNIYCDSLDLKNYYDTIDGADKRIKIRVRWYGDLFGLIEKPVLELKIKKGIMGTKESCRLNSFSLDNNFYFETLANIFHDSDIPAPLKLQLAALKPTILNRYYRSYYQSADGNYRITLDSNMEYYSLNVGPNSYSQKYTDLTNTVLELKYDRKNDCFAHKITNHFSFRMTRNSKYISGVEALVF